jgi:hypothetical protein
MQVFITELKLAFPSSKQIRKLSTYHNATSKELGGLHPSDCLMMQLIIRINHLVLRLEQMLYYTESQKLWKMWTRFGDSNSCNLCKNG